MAVAWGEPLGRYGFGDGHPFGPDRQAAFLREFEARGLDRRVAKLDPRPATRGEIQAFHTPKYVDFVQERSESGSGWLDGGDTPAYRGVYEAAGFVVGSALLAAETILAGEARRAFVPIAGLHHATRAGAAGFCVFNDCGAVIEMLRQRAGLARVAYVDIDAHHGDGVQAQFEHDPRVMTVSVHQHPATLWPGTGWPTEVGDGDAAGTSVNLALMPGTQDRLWLRAFHAVVPSVIAAFRPQIILTQIGVDSHRADPLTDLSLTVDGQAAAMRALRDLADKYCEGRWIAVGGGGYGVINVVPRAWTHLLATALDRDIDPGTAIGAEWMERAVAASAEVHPDYARPPVGMMGDNGDVGFVPWDGDTGASPPTGISDAAQQQTDRAILATRRAVLPLHGLDPEDPRD